MDNENNVGLGGVMLKNRIFRLFSCFCSLIIAMSCLTFSSASADEPVGKMSAIYAYTLNDYLYTYGAMSTKKAGAAITDKKDGSYAPHGVVYSEIVNFDSNENPYLVIFLAASEFNSASCHIIRYNEETEKAERIAILDINHSRLADGEVGVFSLGAAGEKRFIIYRLYKDEVLQSSNYYTAVDGTAYKYVVEPEVASEIGVMDFSSSYFHSGVDISNGNKSLSDFFDKLKNSAANSVTYDDIAGRLANDDEKQIESVLKNAVSFDDFDIADYSSREEYEAALNVEPNGDRFYLISEMYSLGDELYYIRFSTDRSYYNYALVRRSGEAENGYQLLKVRTDCIPLSDRELKQIKDDYVRNTLLYTKSKTSLKLYKDADYSGKKRTGRFNLPRINIEKVLNSKARLPAVCIGGGISIALLTILWVYLYSDNE